MRYFLIIICLLNISFSVQIFEDECGDDQDCREFNYSGYIPNKTIINNNYKLEISTIDFQDFLKKRNSARIIGYNIPNGDDYKFYLPNKNLLFFVNSKNEFLIQKESININLTKSIPLDLASYALDLRNFDVDNQYWDNNNNLHLTFYTPDRLPHICIEIEISKIEDINLFFEKKYCSTFSFPLIGGKLLSPNKKLIVKEGVIFLENDEYIFDINMLFENDSLIEGFWLDDNTLYIMRSDLFDFRNPITLLEIKINNNSALKN